MNPLQAEQERRRLAGEPPMTSAEMTLFQNQIDTDIADGNLAEIGSTKTTSKGTKLVGGKYSGMQPRAATRAALTNSPVPTGKSGYVRGGPLSPDRGSSLAPRVAPTSAPMFSGMASPPMPAPTSTPSITSRLLSPNTARPPMLAAGQSPAVQSSAGSSAAPAMARAYTDQRDMGVMARDANGTQFNSGATISRGATPTSSRALTSSYGSGSVTFSPPGQQPAGDPVLRAATAYAKQRQAGGQFGDIGTPADVLLKARAPVATTAQAPKSMTPSAMPPAAQSEMGPAAYLSLPDLNAGPPKAARKLPSPPIVSGQTNNMQPPGSLPPAATAAKQPAGSMPPPPMPKTLDQMKQEADAAALARRPGMQKVTAAVGEGVTSAAKSVNEGVPRIVGGAMDTANDSLKSAGKSINDMMKPTRDWLQGSTTASQAELDYQAALKAEQRKKTGPVVSTAPAGSTPFSTAGVTKPEANVNIFGSEMKPKFVYQ